MELAAQRGLEAMNSAETNRNERGLGKPCAGKPPARFDEGVSSVAGDRVAALSTLLRKVDQRSAERLLKEVHRVVRVEFHAVTVPDSRKFSSISL